MYQFIGILSQKGVILSSTEAEYVATSEAVKEFKFVIKVNFPIVVRADNIGAIFMS
jgi:hypothetical protein